MFRKACNYEGLPAQIADAMAELDRKEHALQERDRYHGVVSYLEGFTETEISSVPTPEDILIRNDTVRRLWDCIQSLPTSQREYILAFYVDGKTMTRIALDEGVSIKSVSWAIQRGIENLRWMMKEYDE